MSDQTCLRSELLVYNLNTKFVIENRAVVSETIRPHYASIWFTQYTKIVRRNTLLTKTFVRTSKL
jgi:hypothetical protein